MSTVSSSTIETDVKGILRGLIVAIVACSWLAISSHCAFAAITAQQETTSSGCPFHSKPAQPSPKPAGIQCCKILRATVATLAKTWARDDAKFSEITFAIREFTTAAAEHSRPALPLDTGPPGDSFAELILQESILAHAPPARG